MTTTIRSTSPPRVARYITGPKGDPGADGTGEGGGTSDHGALTGLADNDHPQYALATALTAHAADTTGVHGIADTTALLTTADVAAFEAAGTVATHAADTTGVHGIADTTALLTTVAVPGDITATGTPSASTYLRGDGTWATPAGGGSQTFAYGLGVSIWAAITHNVWDSVGASGTRLSANSNTATITFDASVPAGTFALHLAHQTASSRGIYTFEFSDDDGATWSDPTSLGGSADTIDGYTASTNRALSTITGIALTEGRWQIRLTMATKNASSSGYFGDVYGLGLTRTGA